MLLHHSHHSRIAHSSTHILSISIIQDLTFDREQAGAYQFVGHLGMPCSRHHVGWQYSRKAGCCQLYATPMVALTHAVGSLLVLESACLRLVYVTLQLPTYARSYAGGVIRSSALSIVLSVLGIVPSTPSIVPCGFVFSSMIHPSCCE